MPAANAAGGVGVLWFCTGTGDAGVTFSRLVERLTHHDDGHHESQSCPFFVAASHAPLPTQPGLAVVGMAAQFLLFALAPSKVSVAAPVAGPPLGSRAPPLNFA
ncbi:hypothetical protein [Castellaniella sp.]|uniref:hypothetical protein n=1 Tax=Castellaniella sp. TaxID=1955812 RepID=UPI003C710497